MRVVLVNKFLSNSGGADRHCVGLGRALARHGHQVAYVAARDDRFPGGGEVSGDDVHYVDATVSHASRDALPVAGRVRAASSAFWNAGAARAMERVIDSFRPDVVHLHKIHPQLSPAPAVVAAKRGLPVVQTFHDFDLISASPTDSRGGFWDRDETRFSYRLLNAATLPYRRRALTARVTEFVSISRFVARVYEHHGIQSTVIPSFVDVDGVEQAPLPFDDRSGVLFVGRLRPEKGVRDVIHVAGALPQIPFTIAGGGDLRPLVDSAAETLDNLTAAGFIADEQELGEMVRRARLVVIPSRCQEGANLVCLESMARGTPVVAYASGGLAENVVEGGGGRIVPMDPELLAQVVRDTYDEREAWSEMSDRGYAAFQQRHSSDVYVRHIEQVYERAVESER
jgi:glycosyltransferase involved in cell wall biosynthesis